MAIEHMPARGYSLLHPRTKVAVGCRWNGADKRFGRAAIVRHL